MNKKLMTMLALLMIAVTGAWASAATVKLLNGVENGTFKAGDADVTTEGTAFSGTLTATPAPGYRLQSVTYQEYITGGMAQARRRAPGITQSKTLTFAGEDYTYDTATGQYTINIESSVNIVITAAEFVQKTDLATATVSGVEANYIFQGQAISPVPVLTIGDVTVPAAEYTVTYLGNTQPGTATLTATANAADGYISEAYKGSIAQNYFIAGEIGAEKPIRVVFPQDEQTTFTYDGQEHKPAIQLTTADGTVIALTEGEHYTVNYAQNVNAGTAQVTVSAVAPLTGSQTLDFTILPKTVGLTWGNSTFTYNGTAQKPSATATGLVGQDECIVTVSGEQTAAGTYTATATALSNANYQLPDAVTQSFTIGKKALTITADAQNIIYGSTIANTTANISTEGLVSGHSVTAITLTTDKTEAGTYAGAIIASAATVKSGDEDVTTNYELTYVAGNLTILQKAAENLTASQPEDAVYTGSAIEPEVTAKDLEKVLVKGQDYDVTYENNVNVGQATVTIIFKGNYEGYIVKNFNVTKKAATITATAQTVTYGSAIANNVDNISAEGLVNGHDVTAITLTTDKTEAGTYSAAITASAATVKSGSEDVTTNYELTYVTGNLTIQKKTVGLTWGNSTFTYNGAAQKPSVTATGLVGQDECIVTVSGEQTAAGTYTATATALSNANYQLPDAVTQSFTIGKKALSVAAEAKSKTFGEADPALTYISQGLVEGDEFTGALTRVAGNQVGTYEILQGTLTAGDNYAINYTSALLTIVEKAAGEFVITGINDEYEWTGSAIEPKPIIKDGDIVLVEGQDYDVTYQDNVNITKEATLTVTYKGNYSGQNGTTFAIIMTRNEDNEQTTEGNTIVIEQNEDGDIEAVVTEAKEDSEGKVSIPETVKGADGQDYTVTTIAADAFDGVSGVKDIYLESHQELTIEDPTFGGNVTGGAKVHVYQTLLDSYAEGQLSALVANGQLVTDITNVMHYFTFSNAHNVLLPEGVSQYICKVIDNKVNIFKVSGNVIRENTGVLLDGDPKTYEFVATNEASTANYDGNDLVAVTNGHHIDNVAAAYLLKDNEFWKMAATGSIPDGKAYLLWPGSAAAAPSRMAIINNGATGISAISTTADDDNAPIFNLQGVRVGKDYKGIVIKNGKKIYNK